MGYAFPVGDIYVPADWYNHCCERNPPSSEPGTDYASGYGTAIGSADAGQVIDLKSSNSSGTGRYVTVRLNDGRTTRSLHMSAIWVSLWQSVGKGQALGLSGASGYGSDWYYGSHLHETLWNCAPFTCPTIDFENYVGGDTPPKPPDPPKPPEEDVKVNSFSKKLALGKNGTVTIKENTWGYLYLDSAGTNSKLVTGPNLNVTAVLSVTFDDLPTATIKDGVLVVPESVQVEPVIGTRQADGSVKNSSLLRQEIIASPGLTRAKVPIDVALANDKQYLRIKLFAPAGQGDVVVTEAYIRGAEYLKS